MADDLASRIEDKGQFGLGHAPAGVAANADGLAGADDFFGHRFEKELGPFGSIHFVVSGGAEIGFLDAGGLAAEIGDAGGPDFLQFDGSG